MQKLSSTILTLGIALAAILTGNGVSGQELKRIAYNNPGLVVDLGVGLWAWPMPMDYDADGDMDLVVSCPDKPYNGTYFFENPGTGKDSEPMPVFKPSVRIAAAISNAQVSYVDGQPRILAPGIEYADFRKSGIDRPNRLNVRLPIHKAEKIRANQWRYADYDGDGLQDLIVGIEDWTQYGWDNAFNAKGEWTRGPLHGYVYYLRNAGTNDKPQYADPERLAAGGKDLDGYGMPSPSLADFDGDGDLDLLCGEFLDGFTYYENTGTRTQPQLALGKRLTHGGDPVRMDLQMITPVAVDWDGDGDHDLICGDEDGRVAFIEHTGKLMDNLPQFLPPRYFQQEAKDVKFGALVTPFSFDWDGDGDEDLICGNTAGYIGFIENLDSGNPPRWAKPKYLEADGKVFRVLAGTNGSIQGPCEAKWGYTTLCVADWDHDGLPDILYNSIWGQVSWLKNIGKRKQPRLAAPQFVEVNWPSNPPKPEWTWWTPQAKQLATQWRTTPLVMDWTKDGLNDLIMLDHEGYLALFERKRVDNHLELTAPQRIFHADGPSVYASKHRPKNKEAGTLQLNDGIAGQSGRRKMCLADWDGDGRTDLLVDSENVNFLRNVSQDEANTVVFHDAGPVSSHILAGHSTNPSVVDWDKNGRPDLLIGAEDGFLYYVSNPSDR